MKIFLIVKGTPEVARKSAEKHGVKVLSGFAEYRIQYNETYLYADEASHDTVIAWYGESGFEPPFPTGYLLFYSTGKEEVTV